MTKKISVFDINVEFGNTTIGKQYDAKREAAAKALEDKRAEFDALYERKEAEGASRDFLYKLSDYLHDELNTYKAQLDKAFAAYEAAKAGWVAAMDAMDMIDWTE